MSFLQPLLLAALPLIALPVVIHLINQRRYQTIRWGAMMFLLAANRMSRGYAKLRQWLILLFRMLAVACLILVISRPLASGWLGLTAGGRPDTTIILLDRSPSMQQQDPGSSTSKLEAGRRQLAQTLNVRGSGRWVLVESVSNAARDIESPDALLSLPAAEPSGSSANLPKMMEAARDYIKANKSGRTEIWICSDIRQNDWLAKSGLWQSLRDSFLEFPQSIRFHLLAYSESAANNVALQVTNVRRQNTEEGADLLVSLTLLGKEGSQEKRSLPVQFDIEGARSEITIEMDGPTFELKDHRIPIEGSRERGWGKVSIPADANPADNDFYFVFDRSQPRQALIVSDDSQVGEILKLTAEITSDPEINCSAEIIEREQLATVDWDAISLLLWCSSLPDEKDAPGVQAFVKRGGQVVFFPPSAFNDGEFMGIGWQSWVEPSSETSMETWRGDQDILANTQSGAALPVGQLRIRRYCRLEGEFTPLASLKGGHPLLARLPSDRGGVYFCATTPAARDSSLAANGVVMYVFVQRLLAEGAEVLGRTRQLVAGSGDAEPSTTWKQVVGPPDAISTDFSHRDGVYSAGEKLLAVNRAASEDQAEILSSESVSELFSGLDFARVDDRSNSFANLIQEVWRLFLASMLVAILVEAALCMPKQVKASRSDQIDVRGFRDELSQLASPGKTGFEPSELETVETRN